MTIMNAKSTRREFIRATAGVTAAATVAPRLLRAGQGPQTDKMIGLQIGAVSFVGMIERIMIEWQDGELDLSIDQIIDHIVAMFLIAGAAAGITRLPAA